MMDSWDDFNQELYDSIYFRFTDLIDSTPKSQLFNLGNKLDSTYYSVLVSHDSNIKIFQWEYINGGSMEEYQCLVLFRNNDSITTFYNKFWINYLYTLNETSKSYIITGYEQNCSTCFQDFALIINSTDSLNYFESEKYRHSYFSADVIHYNPDRKTLSVNYTGVSSDDLNYTELYELQEHFKYLNNSFIPIKKQIP
jgi:hypothetical protein